MKMNHFFSPQIREHDLNESCFMIARIIFTTNHFEKFWVPFRHRGIISLCLFPIYRTKVTPGCLLSTLLATQLLLRNSKMCPQHPKVVFFAWISRCVLVPIFSRWSAMLQLENGFFGLFSGQKVTFTDCYNFSVHLKTALPFRELFCWWKWVSI